MADGIALPSALDSGLLRRVRNAPSGCISQFVGHEGWNATRACLKLLATITTSPRGRRSGPFRQAAIPANRVVLPLPLPTDNAPGTPEQHAHESALPRNTSNGCPADLA